MANEVVNLKYRLPKLTFKIKPSTGQTYTVSYRLWSSSADDSRNWTQFTTNYAVDVNGNCTNTLASEYIISNLYERSDYQLKFSNNVDNSKEYICTFKTGIAISMSDSPYYDKTLFPGQTFDWYIAGMNSVGVPTSQDASWYYKLNSKKSEVISADQEVWYSMIPMPRGSASENWGTFSNTTTDGLSAYNMQTGFAIKNGSYIALPYCDGSGVVTVDDMDAGITAYGVLSTYSFNIGFGFYITSYNAINGTTLCFVDNTGYVDSGTAAFYYRMYVNNSGRICTTLTNGTNTTTSIDTNITIQLNHWYYCWPNSNGTTIRIYDITKASADADVSSVTLVGTATGQTVSVPSVSTLDGSTKKTPFCFGDANTNDLYINNVLGNIKQESSLVKVVHSEYFIPTLQYTFTVGGSEYIYMQNSKFTSSITSDKVSFIIDPAIWSCNQILDTIDTSTIGAVVCDIYSGGTKITTSTTKKTFSGFTITDSVNSTTQVVGGLIRNNTFLEDSFDIQFGNKDTAFNGLQKYFFPKHGTWGGFNGGVSGNNVYLDEYSNLVLEAHGDKYTGTVPGLLKESLATTYTGYGTNSNLNFSWDTRTNKLNLRTGSCIMTNKYLGYGEMDIWMRLPVGLYGVCPAIWLEHYIEIPENDYRYKTAPYVNMDIQGSLDDGYYRVMNNEIDIEMPSHVAAGTFSNWAQLEGSYFDPNALDTKYMVGVSGTSLTDAGTFVLNNISAPTTRASWTQYSQNILKRYQPSYTNCKFNNWIGELNSGNGWGSSALSYLGKQDGTDTDKEEYLAMLTHLCSGTNGYADGQWHKWTIKWLPTETVLYIDDVKMRENKCFVPINQMKFILAMWFPTMASCGLNDSGNVVKMQNKAVVNATGILDGDGIYGTENGYITAINNNNPIGTWAGNSANFDIAKLIINRIKYTKYVANDIVEGHTITQAEIDNLGKLGESYPESGLRMISTQ